MNHIGPLFAQSPLWRPLFWISYSAWFLVEMWIFSRDRRHVAGENKDRGTLFLIILIIGLGIGGAFSFGFRRGAAIIPAPANVLLAVGLALVWAGIAFRLWAVITLGRFFRYTVMVQDDHRLITTGPYRFLRNPSYTGGVITVAGIGLMFGNWASLACMVAGPLIAYGIRIKVEEKALRERFGAEFDSYARRTWAIIPPIW